MNLLNSVIVEGAMQSGVSDTNTFVIETVRYSKVGEEKTETHTLIKGTSQGALLDFIKQNVKPGYKVRIVGRLQDIEGSLGIFVEQVTKKEPCVGYRFQTNEKF